MVAIVTIFLKDRTMPSVLQYGLQLTWHLSGLEGFEAWRQAPELIKLTPFFFTSVMWRGVGVRKHVSVSHLAKCKNNSPSVFVSLSVHNCYDAASVYIVPPHPPVQLRGECSWQVWTISSPQRVFSFLPRGCSLSKCGIFSTNVYILNAPYQKWLCALSSQ